jgi:hypothetical protein
MRTILILAGCLAVLAGPALAGRNANGALVVHTTPENIYRFPNFCATATPTVCEELNPTSQDDIDIATVIWFLAAFQAQASPGVTAIQFGIQHSLPAGQGYFEYWRDCGPEPSEVPDAGWPEVSDTGNILSFADPVYDTVFKFYFFAVWHDSEQDFVSIRTYPATDEAKFFDTTNPPVEDRIYNFGTIRWEVPGENQCPQPPEEGACCFADGHCEFLADDMCVEQGGTPQGAGTTCETVVCESVPTENTTWGSIKTRFR